MFHLTLSKILKKKYPKLNVVSSKIGNVHLYDGDHWVVTIYYDNTIQYVDKQNIVCGSITITDPDFFNIVDKTIILSIKAAKRIRQSKF